MKITTFRKKSPPGRHREAPEGALFGFGRIWEDFGVPMGPHFLTFLGKKGPGEEVEKSQIFVSTVAGGRRPLMSLQDMSLGLVWKCIALTRQAQALGLARRIGAQRRPATMPRRYPDPAHSVFFVG